MNFTRPERSFFDRLLVTVGGVFSAYAIGMSVGKENLAQVVAIAALASSLLGYFIGRWVKDKPIAEKDGIFLSIISISCFFFIFPLNGLLPEGGFPLRIMAASSLCWMLILCPAFAWRDATLLFLSLPAIALFGLVGTFDTFPPSIWLFFVFLLAMGVLYARIHQRAMIERAKGIGSDNMDSLNRGPWKWMAGPEWALASGMIIICISLISAPVVQQSVKGVSGTLNSSIPRPQAPQRQQAPRATTEYRIGRGPNQPTDDPIFKIKVPFLVYIQNTSYSTYSGEGWSRATLPQETLDQLPPVLVTDDDEMAVVNDNLQIAWEDGVPPLYPMSGFEKFDFEIHALKNLPANLYTPGPVSELKDPRTAQFFPGGDIVFTQSLSTGTTVRGSALLPDVNRARNGARAKLDGPLEGIMTTQEGISDRVKEFAQQAAAGEDSDFNRAVAVQQAITNQVKYNLLADATPRDADPVEHFLFDSQEGYCDLFASAMVQGARSIGLPARFTTGFLINDGNRDSEGRFTIREKDYHAWAEIYFEDVGWVIFDATYGAQQVEGAERGSAVNPITSIFDNPIVTLIINIVLIGGIGIPLVAWFGRRWLEMRRSGALLQSEFSRTLSGFIKSVERLAGRPKRFSSTLEEFVTNMSEALQDQTESARKLARRFDRIMFADGRISKAELASLKNDVKSFQDHLKQMKPAES